MWFKYVMYVLVHIESGRGGGPRAFKKGKEPKFRYMGTSYYLFIDAYCSREKHVRLKLYILF